MKHLIITCLLALLFVLPGCKSTGVNVKNDLSLGGFNGVWEGRVTAVADVHYPFNNTKYEFNGSNNPQKEIRLVIQGEKVEIYTLINSQWQQLIPEPFHFSVHKTNAVIYASRSASDGGWVETVSFSLTKKDENALYMYHIRMINHPLKAAELDTEKTSGRVLAGFTAILNKNNDI
ncbi:hypothetical protein [Thalassomonas actiniarum]|uniref:Lipoprotein n=1 Tax=Thalassomonas actiniarum TaxID=485447 RepID=A0AAE9YT67_9GAMM|nr:hypothetical protein [Thalassomonas actiniarum]WDE00651.1 hypothetical protein SG35_008465 [Thalassomonas actiniarum]